MALSPPARRNREWAAHPVGSSHCQYADGMSKTDRLPGSRWWKVDFHSHSPSSFDFGADEGADSQVDVDVCDWLVVYMEAGVDALVITDHNTHEGIDIARAALDLLRSAADPRFRELVIFPGVELTTPDGYHLLAVFDQDSSSEVVNGVLHKCGFGGTRGTSDATTTKSFQDVVGIISADGGLAIPAHADGPAGLFGMDGRNINAIHEQKQIFAVEMVSSDTKDATDRGWVPVLGSDAHHLDASEAPDPSSAKYPGSHFTWAKMGIPTLAGLRLAISDGSSSLVRSIDQVEDPNAFGHTALLSLLVRQGGVEMEYRLSPWMNAIIGGRGTGKSTVVELLRLALGRFDEMPEKLKKDLEWFSPHSRTETTNRAWNSETEIEVVYSRLGNTYRILWSGAAPMSPQIELLTVTGWSAQEGNVAERFPLLVNSQKQIYEMATDPRSLLALIDQQPDLDYATWKQQYEVLTLQYRTQRAEIEEVRNWIAEEGRLRGNLADAETLVERLNKLRDSPEARELDALQDSESRLQRLENAATALETRLNSALDIYREEVEPLSAPEITWDVEIDRHAAIAEAVDSAVGVVDKLALSRDALERAREAVNPRGARIAALRGELFAPAEGRLEIPNSESTLAEIDQYDEALNRRNRLQGDLERIEREKTRMVALAATAGETLNQVGVHRRALTERRRAIIDTLSSGDFRLKLFSQADKSGMERALRHMTQRPISFDALFSAGGLESVLSQNTFHPNYARSIDTLKVLLKELRTLGKDAPSLGAYGGPNIDLRFIQHLESLDGVQFDADVDLWFPEDRLQVLYRQEGEVNLKPIDEASPGQKTAALLAVILQLGTQPLILDQPEDDLDNLLIFDLVVRTLRKVKTKRQVIVVTHNANIVVNADAEQVIVLKHGRVPIVTQSGAIQSPEVRAAICSIMEGGELAFEARYRKLIGERRV